jgi:hypothetical protein
MTIQMAALVCQFLQKTGFRPSRLQLVAIPDLGQSQVWGGSGGNRRLRVSIIGWMEFLCESGTERAVVDSAANLRQKIGPSPRPAQLLRFVHPAGHQKIACPFGDRSTNAQSDTVLLGVVDRPVALAGEITIQRVQSGPSFPWGHDGLSLAVLAPKMTHHRANPIDADLSVLGFAVP